MLGGDGLGEVENKCNKQTKEHTLKRNQHKNHKIGKNKTNRKASHVRLIE